MTDTRDPEEIDRDFFAVDADRVVYPPGFNPYRETLRIIDRMLDLLDRVVAENGVGEIPTATGTRAK
ncbi:hypothetical protein RN51_00439 [Microbacterium oxydans]|uniref:Uncharacterized protein n=1 Tax=Microbacterium oxydans TaxID=82380 RepID=A0A0F0KYE9_9MICO|nr:hypothetical protein [Microbacterium oxydans]KJL25932.1 hypothetical protein RN51_00439 [Microbacterium oxydans]